ncbi:MAG: class I SAM-dependent methyltransferase [Paracoccaceae bacterium]|nr:class I SAM-dependent methyltransferase [Paracoccaceae bacterium]
MQDTNGKPAPDPARPRARGLHYHQFLSRLHRFAIFDWYLEIGCRSGTTFAETRSKTIAVDPFFRVQQNVIGNKRVLHVFQMTSDEFFAGGFLKTNAIRPGFAFLDGMHLVEYALRDFMNVEANASEASIVAIHDCCPWTIEMTTRDIGNLPKGAWTGDVWKLVPILQKYRPDLTLTMLDSRPTGLLLVSGLDPASRALAGSHDGIVAEFADLEMAEYGLDRFYDLFQFAGADEMAKSGFDLFSGVPRDRDGPLTTRQVTP